MKAKTYDYFLNLDKMKLKRTNGVIILEDESLDPDAVKSFSIADKKFFKKSAESLIPDKSIDPYCIQAIASCNLFHNSGILTPPIYLACKPKHDMTYQMCEDVHHPEFSKCIQPALMPEYSQFIREIEYELENDVGNTWAFLHDKNIKDYFLTFMTEDCFSEILSLFAIDNLRSEIDRHTYNYFLYKLPGSDKYNGVIAIDHESVFFPTHFVNKSHSGNVDGDTFKSKFLRNEVKSYTPIGGTIYASHEQNIHNLKKVIYDGLLPLDSILSIKDALNYDFPAQIKNVGNKYHYDGKEINDLYDATSYLWEYNRRELNKDLGL